MAQLAAASQANGGQGAQAREAPTMPVGPQVWNLSGAVPEM